MNYQTIMLKAMSLHGTNDNDVNGINDAQAQLMRDVKSLHESNAMIIGFVRTGDKDELMQDSVIQHWFDKTENKDSAVFGIMLGIEFYFVDDLPFKVVIGLFPENTTFA